MSGLLSGIGDAIGGLALSSASAIVQGILTGSTRQIAWPILDQLGDAITAFGGTADATSLGADITSVLGSTVGGIASSLVSGLSGYVAILEEHRDELEITSHPVEQGATITDHAYKLPANLTMQIGWSSSNKLQSILPNLLGIATTPITPLDIASVFTGGGSDIFIRHLYSQFLGLQAQRTLLTIYTGKRIYQNMLIQSISEHTTSQTEHALILTLSLKEIFIAKVRVIQVPTNPNAQALPQVSTPSTPQGQVQPGPAPNVNTNDLPVPPIPPEEIPA